MHIAILMTNTDESAFAQARPKDGEKFRRLVHLVRPAWTVTDFTVTHDIFPDSMAGFDGAIITGSPASVYDTDPWVSRLEQLIVEMCRAQLPVFGACYGHQAIARALGGQVETNPNGWVFGLTTSRITAPAPWMAGLPETLYQYGAHIEVVTQLPEAAQILSRSDACANTGFRIGNHVYTTQNHPEMTADFIADLIDAYEPKLPDGVGAAARASLTHEVDQAAYAETIAKFFEMASID